MMVLCLTGTMNSDKPTCTPALLLQNDVSQGIPDSSACLPDCLEVLYE